jgi:putative aminopeptidase FrvX
MPDNNLNDYIVDQIKNLVSIPSPAGNAGAAVEYLETELSRMGIRHNRTRRGALLVTLPGHEAGPHRTLLAHVDTLAAMVKEILVNGSLRLTAVGGFAANTIEGEYCTVVTNGNTRFRGTILIDEASIHVNPEKLAADKRDLDHMVVRLDAEVKSRADTERLGIAAGDYVHFDPRCELTDTGFVKSRHLDDKAGVACLLGVLRTVAGSRQQPCRTTHFYFSTSEEVGFGASAGVPEETGELLAVDMGAVGKGQESDEYTVAICAKDSTGPFDYGLRRRLVDFCQRDNIPFKVDTYPHYGSDAAVAVRAGIDAIAGLIGPGIDASHNLERTHRRALDATMRLILAYLELLPKEVTQ